jgi:hypothetical protein
LNHDKVYNAGYDRGYEDASSDLGLGVNAFMEAARRLGFPILDGFCVRWDAAEGKAVLWTPEMERRVSDG